MLFTGNTSLLLNVMKKECSIRKMRKMLKVAANISLSLQHLQPDAFLEVKMILEQFDLIQGQFYRSDLYWMEFCTPGSGSNWCDIISYYTALQNTPSEITGCVIDGRHSFWQTTNILSFALRFRARLK